MPLDIDDFKSNSHKSKENRSEPEKRTKRVIENAASIRKKSKFKKFLDEFLSNDKDDIKSYLIEAVLVPAIKDAVLDSVKALLGKNDTKSRESNVSYRKYYNDRDRTDSSFRSRTVFNYDEILFKTRADAELVLDQMEDIIAQYGVVSVLDLYDLADVENDNPMTGKYGWTRLRNAFAMRVDDGYVLKLPKALPLD